MSYMQNRAIAIIIGTSKFDKVYQADSSVIYK